MNTTQSCFVRGKRSVSFTSRKKECGSGASSTHGDDIEISIAIEIASDRLARALLNCRVILIVCVAVYKVGSSKCTGQVAKKDANRARLLIALAGTGCDIDDSIAIEVRQGNVLCGSRVSDNALTDVIVKGSVVLLYCKSSVPVSEADHEIARVLSISKNEIKFTVAIEILAASIGVRNSWPAWFIKVAVDDDCVARLRSVAKLTVPLALE